MPLLENDCFALPSAPLRRLRTELRDSTQEQAGPARACGTATSETGVEDLNAAA
ncbi:MAG: hypothetical protein AAGK77_11175 [Pseudomonadota bacterium]